MIHKYKMNDYNIVLDVNSGAVHTVDELTFQMLDHYEDLDKNQILQKFYPEYSYQDITECYDEITNLVNNKTLFSEDIYEKMTKQIDERSPVIKAMCLHVAHDCNLKCKYCFAQEGEYNGNRNLMSFETGKQAFDFLIQNSGKRKNLEVDFFGGEPLMVRP